MLVKAGRILVQVFHIAEVASLASSSQELQYRCVETELSMFCIKSYSFCEFSQFFCIYPSLQKPSLEILQKNLNGLLNLYGEEEK